MSFVAGENKLSAKCTGSMVVNGKAIASLEMECVSIPQEPFVDFVVTNFERVSIYTLLKTGGIHCGKCEQTDLRGWELKNGRCPETPAPGAQCELTCPAISGSNNQLTVNCVDKDGRLLYEVPPKACPRKVCDDVSLNSKLGGLPNHHLYRSVCPGPYSCSTTCVVECQDFHVASVSEKERTATCEHQDDVCDWKVPPFECRGMSCKVTGTEDPDQFTGDALTTILAPRNARCKCKDDSGPCVCDCEFPQNSACGTKCNLACLAGYEQSGTPVATCLQVAEGKKCGWHVEISCGVAQCIPPPGIVFTVQQWEEFRKSPQTDISNLPKIEPNGSPAAHGASLDLICAGASDMILEVGTLKSAAVAATAKAICHPTDDPRRVMWKFDSGEELPATTSGMQFIPCIKRECPESISDIAILRGFDALKLSFSPIDERLRGTKNGILNLGECSHVTKHVSECADCDKFCEKRPECGSVYWRGRPQLTCDLSGSKTWSFPDTSRCELAKCQAITSPVALAEFGPTTDLTASPEWVWSSGGGWGGWTHHSKNGIHTFQRVCGPTTNVIESNFIGTMKATCDLTQVQPKFEPVDSSCQLVCHRPCPRNQPTKGFKLVNNNPVVCGETACDPKSRKCGPTPPLQEGVVIKGNCPVGGAVGQDTCIIGCEDGFDAKCDGKLSADGTCVSECTAIDATSAMYNLASVTCEKCQCDCKLLEALVAEYNAQSNSEMRLAVSCSTNSWSTKAVGKLTCNSGAIKGTASVGASGAAELDVKCVLEKGRCQFQIDSAIVVDLTSFKRVAYCPVCSLEGVDMQGWKVQDPSSPLCLKSKTKGDVFCNVYCPSLKETLKKPLALKCGKEPRAGHVYAYEQPKGKCSAVQCDSLDVAEPIVKLNEKHDEKQACSGIAQLECLYDSSMTKDIACKPGKAPDTCEWPAVDLTCSIPQCDKAGPTLPADMEFTKVMTAGDPKVGCSMTAVVKCPKDSDDTHIRDIQCEGVPSPTNPKQTICQWPVVEGKCPSEPAVIVKNRCTKDYLPPEFTREGQTDFKLIFRKLRGKCAEYVDVVCTHIRHRGKTISCHYDKHTDSCVWATAPVEWCLMHRPGLKKKKR
eukprot:c7475_g1_i1.p1 GENE.c7475_g1_i1~~c7475_g1_i1.p1  ORF type:complete len:1099 (+),score=281.08 c7475_g1_i1:140-3436(+)